LQFLARRPCLPPAISDDRDAALRGLSAQQSPEIPIAVAAIEELRATVGDVASEYAALADSCELYAAQVDEKREQIKALIREVLAMIVEGILISAAIGAITAGAGAAAGAGAVVVRVAAQSPRFAAILNALRSAAAAGAAAVRSSRVLLTGARGRLAIGRQSVPRYAVTEVLSAYSVVRLLTRAPAGTARAPTR